MKEIKLFISDMDGVLTNNKFYDNGGDVFKVFNHYDIIALALLYINNIKVAVITESHNKTIEERFLRQKINDIVLGVNNKVKEVEKLKNKYNLEWDEIAYIGDDINDIDLLKKVGLSAVPSQVSHYVKSVADISLSKHGGDGVFREFVEYYLDQQGVLNETIEKFRNINK